MPLIISNTDVKNNANLDTIESIVKYGLRPQSQITGHNASKNATTPSKATFENICVNYLNLERLAPSHVESVLEAAVYEEYCGIYGITLERKWPFQRFVPNRLFAVEMEERLNQSLLFMLKPPTLRKGLYNLSHLRQPTTLAFYETAPLKADGVTQSLGRNLLNLSQVTCPRITEYKTTHCFSMQEVLCIFAPEEWFDKAKEVFQDNLIIKVGSCNKTFHDIPAILNLHHEQQLLKPVSVSVPDYYQALLTYINTYKIEEFSLHVVRLQTQFDFITRKIQSLVGCEALVQAANAQVQHLYPDGSAWIAVSKNNGVSKQKMIASVAKHLPAEYLKNLTELESHSMKICEELTSAKGIDYSLTFVYEKLSKYQLIRLEKMGVQIVQQPLFYVLNFLLLQKKEVEEIIKIPKKQASTQIQAVLRGFWSRKNPKSEQQARVSAVQAKLI